MPNSSASTRYRVNLEFANFSDQPLGLALETLKIETSPNPNAKVCPGAPRRGELRSVLRSPNAQVKVPNDPSTRFSSGSDFWFLVFWFSSTVGNPNLKIPGKPLVQMSAFQVP